MALEEDRSYCCPNHLLADCQQMEKGLKCQMEMLHQWSVGRSGKQALLLESQHFRIFLPWWWPYNNPAWWGFLLLHCRQWTEVGSEPFALGHLVKTDGKGKIWTADVMTCGTVAEPLCYISSQFSLKENYSFTRLLLACQGMQPWQRCMKIPPALHFDCQLQGGKNITHNQKRRWTSISGPKKGSHSHLKGKKVHNKLHFISESLCTAETTSRKWNLWAFSLPCR